ncbi:MAG: xanthine dehydrogenase family protein molybdopterin-binding subunit [Burkholderiaceae bacterium]|nr:xanthine dehydrogenase family protein molybdopterin-binding subunit [Burkholderiaceae bacterium]
MLRRSCVEEPDVNPGLEDSPRRAFLKATGALGGGLVLGFFVPVKPARAVTDAGTAFQPNAFLRVGSDGTVTVIVGLAEMGQGILTGIAQLMAEELEADWSKVRVELAPTDPAYNNPVFGFQGTGGSFSTRGHWEPMRRAGATAREMLISAAALTWRVDPASCSAEQGKVVHPSGRQASYGELAAKAATLPIPPDARLKDPKDFRIIGKALKQLDSPDKIRGAAAFGIDVRLRGMLVCLVARPPVLGSKLVSFDAAKTKQIPGVRQVVSISSGVAVVADGFWPAKLGRDALQVTWDEGTGAHLSSAGISAALVDLTAKPGIAARNDGDVDSPNAKSVVEAIYEVPYLAHACMEPMNCTAVVKSDSAEVWAPTESPGLDRDVLAKVAGVDPARLTLHTTLMGCGFGRRFARDFSIDAVEVAKAVATPVQVIYSREDDMKGQYYRPAAAARLRAGLDDAGRPVSLLARTACSSILRAAGWPLKNGIDGVAVDGLKQWPYDTDNVRVEWAPYENGIVVWWWRSEGSSQNVYFVESFIDELAHAAGRDPFEYRRALLTHSPRLRGVLEAAADKSDWRKPLPTGRARGIAACECFGSFVAQVAEVSVSAGHPRIHRVVCAVDCGQIVNPEAIKRQIEGGVIFGISAALYGNISLKDGRVEQGNFDDYRVIRMGEAPPIDVHILASSEKPGGVGEIGTPPTAPAVCNAIFSLTGKRVRKLPVAALEGTA